MQSLGYHRAETVADALSAMNELGSEGQFLAGGQTLVNELKHRNVPDPVRVVDVGGLDELDYVARDGDGLRIGALTTHATLSASDAVAGAVPVLSEMVEQVADVQVRNEGTVGGNLARADPCTDYPVVLDVLDAVVTAQSVAGEREIPIDEFYVDHFETSLADDELLVEVSVEVPDDGTAVAFRKFARRGYSGERRDGRGDLALVNAAVRVDADGGICRDAAVSVGCVAGTPVRATDAESILAGQELATVAPTVVGDAAAEEVDPDDHDGRVRTAYKRELVGSLVAEATSECLSTVGGEH